MSNITTLESVNGGFSKTFEKTSEKEILPDKWAKMTGSQLQDQKNILMSRLMIAGELRNEALIMGLQTGIETVETLIKKKAMPGDDMTTIGY